MSAAEDLPEDFADGPGGGPEVLAGEYVLGLLTSAELLDARGRLARDPSFAREVAGWEAHIAPLFDEIAPSPPPASVWAAIEAALAEQPLGSQIARLQRQVRQWRIGTGVAAALAGVLAIVGLRPDGPVPPPPHTIAQPPLAAALAPKGGGSISVVYRPDERRLTAIAADLGSHRGHDMELWVLPPGGAPLPLGLVTAEHGQLALAAGTSARLVAGSTIAVSLEPVGGSPTGLPTGPVLATAKISPA